MFSRLNYLENIHLGIPTLHTRSKVWHLNVHHAHTTLAFFFAYVASTTIFLCVEDAFLVVQFHQCTRHHQKAGEKTTEIDF